MTSMLSGLCSTLFCVCVGTVLSIGPLHAQYRQQVSGWNVFDFTTKERDGTEIIGCMASRSYRGNTRVSFVVTNSYSWAIGVANEAWSLRNGATTDVAVYADGRFVASGRAWHIDDKSALLPISGSDPYRAIQTAQRLDLQTPYGSLAFQMIGTRSALAALIRCVDAIVPKQPFLR